MTQRAPTRPAATAALRQPVSVPPPPPTVKPRRVVAIIPCHNRPRDLHALLNDLACLAQPSPFRPAGGLHSLCLVIVDNASSPPISPPPHPLPIHLLRNPHNTGGSGGFNAGIRFALTLFSQPNRSEPTSAQLPAPDDSHTPADHDLIGDDCLWLLDSDVRLDPDALQPLLDALQDRPDLVAVGSALADPDTGEIFELGGRIDPRTGEYVQPLPARPWPSLVPCQYLAACSLLVRRLAVERAGLMPDVFISGDDVAWSLRLTRIAGGGLAAVPASVVRHPRPDRMRTTARYYIARNAFAVLAAADLGRRARFHRALRELARAMCQTLIGGHALADCHLAGLRDAARGAIEGPATDPHRLAHDLVPWSDFDRRAAGLFPPAGPVPIESGLPPPAHLSPDLTRRLQPMPDLGLFGAVLRVLGWPRPPVAIVSARGRPNGFLAARVVVAVDAGGYAVRRLGRIATLRRAARVMASAGLSALRLTCAPPRTARVEPLSCCPAVRPTLSIVIVTRDRPDALRRTLQHLRADPATAGAEILVVDNASTTPIHPEPGIRCLRQSSNLGVQAFNAGVHACRGDVVLVLDDDAWPQSGALAEAMDLLATRLDLAAVVLHPHHPATGRSEWPFATRLAARDDWPLMGCANLVRRWAWLRVGGYEPPFFLYRNDVDLALKLRRAGLGVHFNPRLIVWHDSPAATRKSPRWFELATRNWIWLARRHGRGAPAVYGALAGWAWAHRLAGLDLRDHARVVRGAIAGLTCPPPPVPQTCLRDGRPYRTMLRLRRHRPV